jgi:hypothetical protein
MDVDRERSRCSTARVAHRLRGTCSVSTAVSVILTVQFRMHRRALLTLTRAGAAGIAAAVGCHGAGWIARAVRLRKCARARRLARSRDLSHGGTRGRSPLDFRELVHRCDANPSRAFCAQHARLRRRCRSK